MTEESMKALRARLQDDEGLAAQFAKASTPEDVQRVVEAAGLDLDVSALPGGRELSDAELAGVSGGYTFPRTDWVYCDNPWTNAWCTLKC